MVTVGLYVGERETAAAVAALGAVVSAVTRPRGPAVESDGGVLACVEEGLRLSGFGGGEIDAVVVAQDAEQTNAAETLRSNAVNAHAHRTLRAALQQKPWREVSYLAAEAAQFRGETGDGIIIAVEASGRIGAQAFSKTASELRCLKSLSGIRDLLQAAACVADVLGARDGEPLSALDRYYGSSDRSIDSILAACIHTEGGGSVRVDMDGIERLLADAQGRSPAPLDDREAVHVNVHRTRTALATGVVDRIADVFADIALEIADDADFIGFAGRAFDAPALVARIESRVESARFSPASERGAAALGASLLPHETVSPLRDINIGPSFTDEDIKTSLENCRLDYVYEPDWNKLFARTSTLLGSGAIVGWFQGKAEFGSRSLGARSVLCDPSNQYARENMNVFLLRREAGAPLPVSICRPHASSLHASAPARFRYVSADALPVPREKLGAAIDRQGRCLAHIADERATPELCQLLGTHRARTDVPGLINVPLASADGLVSTPRAAIRESFGSAVDVLVMGRFLASKDYWLLRSRRV
jgi:carbamoyltransferase-like protein